MVIHYNNNKVTVIYHSRSEKFIVYQCSAIRVFAVFDMEMKKKRDNWSNLSEMLST